MRKNERELLDIAHRVAQEEGGKVVEHGTNRNNHFCITFQRADGQTRKWGFSATANFGTRGWRNAEKHMRHLLRGTPPVAGKEVK